MSEIKEVFSKLSDEFSAMAKTIEYQKAVISRLNNQPVCPYACHDAAVSKTVYPKHPLNDYSWCEIALLSQSGMADKRFNVGDEKEFQLNDGSTIHARIIGFNHDQSDIALPLGITFETVETLNKDYQMNKKNTNDGGWAESYLRKMLNSDIYGEALPGGLREVIKPCTKLTFNDGELSETVDKLFILSEQEVFGRKIFSNGGEGKWYEYYRRENTEYGKMKQNGERDWRWERSPLSSAATGFCNVVSGGTADLGNASSAFGVAFGFCI
jgi:hypothetical protein